MSLIKERIAYKPFQYPWAYDYWKKQQEVHWMAKEVPMADDVNDWHNKLTPGERNLLTHIFRFFTQSDIEVQDNYHQRYLSVFKPTEIKMMLSAFANMETVHIDAYSTLIETIGMPETEYQAFLEYAAMKAKYDYMRSFKADDDIGLAETMAAFGAFTEGLQLFASFAILLNFPRHNRMKGMGQIVTWSVRDESLHCEGIIRLYHEWVRERRLVRSTELAGRIAHACKETVSHEDAFIDLSFEAGDVRGLTRDDVKAYIRYIADKRLDQLKQPRIYGIKRNPLPWLDEILNAPEHANFFEARATEYSKAATTGTWDEAFDGL